MTDFFYCVGYLAMLGIFSHFFGESLPRRLFRVTTFPWKPFAFEKNGKIYGKLKIRKWKDKLPDMSRVLPDMLPKVLGEDATSEKADALIRETCVAELTHDFLIVLGFGCVFIWDSVGGWILSFVFATGNVPFIMIQRFNRPQMVRVQGWLSQKEHDMQIKKACCSTSRGDDMSGENLETHETEILNENIDTFL